MVGTCFLLGVLTRRMDKPVGTTEVVIAGGADLPQIDQQPVLSGWPLAAVAGTTALLLPGRLAAFWAEQVFERLVGFDQLPDPSRTDGTPIMRGLRACGFGLLAERGIGPRHTSGSPVN